MAWALALGRGRPRPADPSMSGALPVVPGFDLQLDGLAGLPITIARGTQDPMDRSISARTRTTAHAAAGANIVYRETNVPHIIDPRVVPAWSPGSTPVLSARGANGA